MCAIPQQKKLILNSEEYKSYVRDDESPQAE